MSSVFRKIGGNRPGRSVFNLSYDKKFDCDMGQLIPVLAEEMVPGDKFQIGNELTLRFQPLVAPIMHEINVYVHYFFVPYRVLDSNWEGFITGGVDGANAYEIPKIRGNRSKLSLWDYFGLPVNVDLETGPKKVMLYLFDAYTSIYNEYYRDENLVNEKITNTDNVLRRAWEKDYFTSALPWQQRGVAPALPISGITNAVFDESLFASGISAPTTDFLEFNGNNLTVASGTRETALRLALNNNNTVDLSNATTFDVSDLRLAFQIQKWMERNARAGVRYTEFLRAHYGVSPRDERLQRPEYIGGSKSPVIVSEVLQTSSSDTTSPQGNLAGHGLSADRNYIGSYEAKEFGIIMGIMSVMPRTTYQQGINRQWLRETRYDFYTPEFANLSEQEIFNAEIYAQGTADDADIFGFTGRYNEMRYKPSMVCGNMRDTLDYWHLSRQFTELPLLNESFIECNPRKDIFAVPSEPGLIVNFGNIIKAIRPIPVVANPGLIDHV